MLVNTVRIFIIAGSIHPVLHLFVKLYIRLLLYCLKGKKVPGPEGQERRKCGPRLHAWLQVLFTQCVLYGITLVRVLSTRIVSISSTPSLILQPNPGMSENMCGLGRLFPTRRHSSAVCQWSSGVCCVLRIPGMCPAESG